jgi:hypothetical protein
MLTVGRGRRHLVIAIVIVAGGESCEIHRGLVGRLEVVYNQRRGRDSN